MTDSDVGQNVVHVACRCPGRPHHPGDTVTLHPAVTVPIGIAVFSVVRQGGSQAEIEAGLSAVYLHLGIASWTFVDEQGWPEPVTPENIDRLLPFGNGGLEVAELANSLYSDEALDPLQKRIAALSASGPTPRSTSASPSSGSKRRTPSGPSSPSDTAAGQPSAVPAS